MRQAQQVQGTQPSRPTVLLIAALVAACGGDGQAPGPIPQIEGLYTGSWSLAVGNDHVTCPASLTVTDQADSTFATTFEVLRRYGSGVGCTDTIETGRGVVRADRSVQALAEVVEPVTCTMRQPNLGLSGTVLQDGITLTGRYTYQCPGDYTWTLRFAGRRGGAPLPAYPDALGAYGGTWTTGAAGVQVACPVTVAFETQARDDVAGVYTLEGAGSCVAQPPADLSGVISVDGLMRLSAAPPVPTGCVVARQLALEGVLSGATLSLAGGFALVCANTLREFTVAVSATRP